MHYITNDIQKYRQDRENPKNECLLLFQATKEDQNLNEKGQISISWWSHFG